MGTADNVALVLRVVDVAGRLTESRKTDFLTLGWTRYFTKERSWPIKF